MPPRKKRQKVIGTLAPLSSLSSINLSQNDQGTFAAGLAFLDWLHKTNQSAWQLLPLNHTQLENGSNTIRVPSPYKGYGIGLDPKYLSSSFSQLAPAENELKEFKEENIDWIHDYALFQALSTEFGTDDWREWIEEFRTRNKETLNKFAKDHKKEINEHKVLQWKLHKEYWQLRAKAKKLGISMIGDLPFYISIKSPLVWANQNIFDLGKNGQMKLVSGVPFGASSHFGRQVWGHPLYNWSLLKNKKILQLWKMRIRYLTQLFDDIRIDHVTAFFQYGALAEDKFKDVYKLGPGSKVLEELIQFGKKCGLSIYVEDSGENVVELQETLYKLKIPGIKILRFSFDEKNGRVIDKYADIKKYTPLTVAYTTTHDTETLVGYLQKLNSSQKSLLAAKSHVTYDKDEKVFAKRLRDAILNSPASTVIIPIQDWLLITDRINIPGTEKEVGDTNWQFKLKIPVEELPVNFK